MGHEESHDVKFISTGIYTFVLTIGAILSNISTWRVYWDLGIRSKSLGAEEEAIINLKLIAGSCWFLLVHTQSLRNQSPLVVPWA